MFRKQGHGVAIDVKLYQLPQLHPITLNYHQLPMRTQNQLPRVWHVELWVNINWLQFVSACQCVIWMGAVGRGLG